MSQETLRIIVAVVGMLVIATRLPGFFYPQKFKHVAGKIAGLHPTWIRIFTLLLSLFGLWLLYSTLVILFSKIPVFMIVCLITGLVLMLLGMFSLHPEWFFQLLRAIFIDRNTLFVRLICFLGVLGGVFILLSALFGSRWGGTVN